MGCLRLRALDFFFFSFLVIFIGVVREGLYSWNDTNIWRLMLVTTHRLTTINYVFFYILYLRKDHYIRLVHRNDQQRIPWSAFRWRRRIFSS
jgi:hypothetical protein